MATDSEPRSIDEVNKENINMAPREAHYYHTEQERLFIQTELSLLRRESSLPINTINWGPETEGDLQREDENT